MRAIHLTDWPAEPAAGDARAPRPATAAATTVQRHVAGVFRFVRCLGADRDLAEDLVQEAFVIAWRKDKLGLPERALAAYLRRSAQLLWLEQRRGRARDEAAVAALALQQWDAEVDDDGSELVAAMRACVQRLQGRAARAVDLAYRQGDSRESIATALGMTPNGVRTLLARTRSRLEQCIRRKKA